MPNDNSHQSNPHQCFILLIQTSWWTYSSLTDYIWISHPKSSTWSHQAIEFLLTCTTCLTHENILHHRFPSVVTYQIGIMVPGNQWTLTLVVFCFESKSPKLIERCRVLEEKSFLVNTKLLKIVHLQLLKIFMAIDLNDIHLIVNIHPLNLEKYCTAMLMWILRRILYCNSNLISMPTLSTPIHFFWHFWCTRTKLCTFSNN